MELVDKSGKVVQVEDDEATKAYASGQYGVKGAQVNVRNKDGTLGTVPADQLQAAISQGYELVSPEEADREILQRDYGGVGGMAVSAGEGAARGLTLGLSDEAAAALGGEQVREHLRKYKQANPGSALGGELAGALAPVVLSGGAAAPEVAAVEGAELGAEGLTAGKALMGAGKAISAPIRAVDAAGGIAERAVQAIVGEGSQSTLARIVQKGLASGARGAVEGALFGVGNEISDAAIEDHDLTGERLLAAIGHGALFGGLTGGALGAGGEALGTGARALGQRVAPALREVGETQAWKSLIPAGSMKKLSAEAERVQGGARGIGRLMLDEGLVKAGDSIEDIAPRLSQAKTAAGERVGELLEQATAQGAKVETSKVVARVEKDVLSDLKAMPNMNRAAIGKVEDFLADMKTKLGDEASLTSFRDFRRMVDGITKFDATADTATNAAMKSLRGSLEDELVKVGDEYSGKMGSDWASAYKDAKLRYQRLAVADKAANQSVIAQNLSNRSVSLTDTIAGGAGLISGGPTGIALSLANKAMRERGSATAASVLDKLADMSALRQVSDRFDARASSAVKEFVEGKTPKALPAPKGRLADQFTQATDEVKAAASNPSGQVGAINQHLATIAQTAPKVANAFRMTAVKATSYLASRIPPSAGKKMDTLQPQFERSHVSDAEMASFMRSYRAVDDPESVLRDMQHGRITMEQADALKNVYPKLYAKLQNQAIAYISSKKGRLTYQQETQLGIMLGFPTNDSLKPESIRAYQASFQGQSSSPQGPRMPAAPKRMLKGFSDNVTLKTRS